VEARAELEERRHAALDADRARCRLRRARDELEERRLSGSVRADDAEALAALDGEAHVLQRLDDLGRRDLTEDELFQGRGAAGPEAVALLDMFGPDRHHAPPC